MLFLSLTVKSPRLILEDVLSKTRNEFPFINPCGDDVVNVVTFDVALKLGVPYTTNGDPRWIKNWPDFGNGSVPAFLIEIFVVELIAVILL